jgi:hypothetical protein
MLHYDTFRGAFQEEPGGDPAPNQATEAETSRASGGEQSRGPQAGRLHRPGEVEVLTDRSEWRVSIDDSDGWSRTSRSLQTNDTVAMISPVEPAGGGCLNVVAVVDGGEPKPDLPGLALRLGAMIKLTERTRRAERP